MDRLGVIILHYYVFGIRYISESPSTDFGLAKRTGTIIGITEQSRGASIYQPILFWYTAAAACG